MRPYGFYWVLIRLYASLLIPMVAYGSLCVFMGSYVFL